MTQVSRLRSGSAALLAAGVAGYALVVGYVLVGAVVYARALLIMHVAVLGSAALLFRLSLRDDQRVRQLLFVGLGGKIFASAVRYVIAFDVYGGAADAKRYHDSGSALALAFRDGDFIVGGTGPLIGTKFIEILTGVLYAATGPTMIGGFIAYACLGFWGAFLFIRALQTALPAASSHRYVPLVLFLPSVVFWPSSVGKDAWMLFALGLAAYGAARIVVGLPRGILFLVTGLSACAFVRPHIALAVAASFAVALLSARRGRVEGGRRSRLMAFVVAVVAISIVLGQVQSYFGLETVDSASVEGLLDNTQQQTSQGGSQFEAARARSVVDIPEAIVSVLFRPFPWESSSPLMLMASMEGVLLAFLLVRFRRDLATTIRRWRDQPFIAFLLAYTVVFCVAFSSFGNFGILARQRVQLFPFVLMLFAMRPAASEELDVTKRQLEVVA